MERSRPPPVAAPTEDIASLPSELDVAVSRPPGVPLSDLLGTLRAGSATPHEVSSFLEGLKVPAPSQEAMRARADVMMDVLADERLCKQSVPGGGSLGVAVLEALQELGYPYALEVTPAILERVRAQQTPSDSGGSLLIGVVLAAASALPIWAVSSPQTQAIAAAVSLALLGPVGLSVLAWLLDRRLLYRVSNGAQWLVGLLCLLSTVSMMGPLFLPYLGVASVLNLLSAYFLSRSPPTDGPE